MHQKKKKKRIVQLNIYTHLNEYHISRVLSFVALLSKINVRILVFMHLKKKKKKNHKIN